MGALSSCCAPPHPSEENSRHATSTPKKKGRHARNLSATFNLSLVDNESGGRGHNLVNINTANEEELMTLPGISRSVAKNIIDYRNHIGGFRRVEDVALTSGVGAEKLSSIRSDIYVVPPVVDFTVAGESYTEVSLGDELVVCVNTANIFSLLRVKGIGMALAKNIVTYRDTHGRYRNLDDLQKVKGIGPANLEIMRPYLTLEEVSENSRVNGNHQPNGKIKSISTNESPQTDVECNPQADIRLTYSSSLQDILTVLGPMAKVPIRPKVEFFSLKHKNEPAFRLASWNLKQFSVEKARNPGVKDAVCMTILENGFGIVCVQELVDIHALKEICDELNDPSLPNVKKWSGRRGHWDYEVSKPTGKMFQGSEYQGFLYDKSQDITLKSSCVLAKSPVKKQLFTRMPFIGAFSIKDGFDCLVVSVHLKATGLSGQHQARTENEAETITDLLRGIQETYKSERDIIFLGDFNLSPDSSAFECLRREGFIPVISSSTFTNISSNNMTGSMNDDNIWISRQTQKVFTGVSGVVRDGLSNAWIPDGWSWGGVVSDHCPVFTQLYSKMDLDHDRINANDLKFVLGGSNVD